MTKDQFVKTLNDYLLAHGYARWEYWDINYEWERYRRGRSWSNEFFSKPNFYGMKCQEASLFTPGFYTPCGKQASAVVWHSRDKRAYLMCAGCTDHNVRNRGGKLIAQEL